MKKILIILTTVFAIGTLSSCTKDYTCTCTDTGNNETVFTIKDAKKDDAEASCKEKQDFLGPGTNCSAEAIK